MVTIKNVTSWINNYNTHLLNVKLIEKIKPASPSQKRVILNLCNHPENFTFEERFYIFRNKRSGNEIFASYVLAILIHSNEIELYNEIRKMTW
jgi:hypothetical protein